MLEDRCPHRGARLSLGKHLGDRIACWYHGVQVDGTGTVAAVPGLPGCNLEGKQLVAAPHVVETGGAILAYFVIGHSLAFIMLSGVIGSTTQLEVTSYIGFVTNMILIFGVAFEFPLVLLMLNFTGVVSAKKLLGWWRIVVFLSFGFAAIATPDPGPFGMTLLAACMVVLYLIATGVAFINDKRKGRGKEIYAGLDDDEVSPLEDDREPVTAGSRTETASPVEAPEPVAKPLPIESRFDDMT
jgi:sec-independent protein translocase protein TatC